ncbi:MAG: hypothetical protein MI794_07730 [Pseudomonadales bacterium]|nr:hypothetical protein [Pseudomonadales bacterium]
MTTSDADQALGDYIGSMFDPPLPPGLKELQTLFPPSASPELRGRALQCTWRSRPEPPEAVTAALFLWLLWRQLPPGALRQALIRQGLMLVVNGASTGPALASRERVD